MREWLRPARDTEAEAKPQPRRQSFLEGIAEFVRDEAIDHVVDKASGGWLSYEGSDDEDDEPRRDPPPPADSFNDRIERALAELRAREQTASEPMPVPVKEPTTDAAPAPTIAVAVSPPIGMRTFGRKPV